MKIIQDYVQFTKNGGMVKKVSTLLLNPCFHSVILFRVESLFYRCHLGIISKIVWYINRMLYHVDIDYRANLAGGFVLVHGLGVVIGMNVVSLGSLTVYQGVTIGGSGKSKEYQGKLIDQPVIGANTVLYTDAKVFGPVVIAPNTKVKAGQLITKDIGDVEGSLNEQQGA